MKTHELKIIPEMFQEIIEGNKKAEVRLNDRDFQKGDKLFLREKTRDGALINIEGRVLTGYSGRNIEVVITHVLSGYGINPNYVCLSFNKL